MRRERLRLRLRERDLLPSSAFSALLERERLLLFETDEASESSSRAMCERAVPVKELDISLLTARAAAATL